MRWALGKDVARALWLAAWLWGGVAARGWARGASAAAGPVGAEVAGCWEAEVWGRDESRAVAGEAGCW